LNLCRGAICPADADFSSFLLTPPQPISAEAMQIQQLTDGGGSASLSGMTGSRHSKQRMPRGRSWPCWQSPRALQLSIASLFWKTLW